MAKEARLSFGRDGSGAGGTNWNNYLAFPVVDSTCTKNPIVDIADGSDQGWDTTGSTPDNNNSTTSGWTGTVTPSWMTAGAAAQAWYLNATETITININGLDNAKTYQIDVYGAINTTTGRYLNVTIGGVDLGEKDVGTAERTWQRTGVSPSGGTISVVFANGASRSSNPVFNALRIVEESAPGLSITSVDTDNAVLAGQSQATFAGTGLASTAKFAVKRGSAIAYGADISLSGSTGGSFTAPTMTAMFSAGVRFGDVAFFAAETSGTAIASISGSITTATNWKYVNVTDLSATGSMGSLFYNNAVSLSDQVAYSSVTTRFKWPVTVSGDGYFTVNSSGSQAGDEFAYRIWDETDSTWGTEGTIEINGGISSAEQVYAAGSLVQVSLESSTLEGATLQ